MKIIDKINGLLENEREQKEHLLEKNPDHIFNPKTWYSYEYFPPKTVAGKSFVYLKIFQFLTITWVLLKYETNSLYTN